MPSLFVRGSCQVRRTVNNRTCYFSLNFSTVFIKHFSLEPARILDFLASDSICKYQNRQTNLLNFIDLTRENFLVSRMIEYYFSSSVIPSIKSVTI